MKTLKIEEKEEQSVDRFANVSFPSEIIEDIFCRLPVISILRCRSVTKPWLSRISDPQFTKLHFNRATADHRTALFISAYDRFTSKRHFLSAALDGGPVTHLMTVDDCFDADITEAEHLNGLVCFTCSGWAVGNRYAHVFVVNPSTRKIFKLPDPTNHEYVLVGYLFGYDESRNEHKIVYIRKVKKSTTIEIMIFSMSNYSWRKIDVDDFSNLDCLSFEWDGGVCVNNVVHVMLQDLSYGILAFDLKTEKLSIISIPQAVVESNENLSRVMARCFRIGEHFRKFNKPRIMKINGCLGVVCHGRVVESNEIDIWMLQDYENRVWVRETIKFPEPWIELPGRYPLPEDVVNMEDDIIFSPSKSKASKNVIIVPIYNKKRRCFKLLQFTLSHRFLCSESVKFSNIKCYVESIMPL